MRKRYLRAPVVLLCVVVFVILAAFVFLRFGVNHTSVRLVEPGKAAELDGFRLSGVAGDENYSQRFQLQDGVLQSEFSLESMQTGDTLSMTSGLQINYEVLP